jgi:integrase/recombinase XerD
MAMERMTLTETQDAGVPIAQFCQDCQLRGRTPETIRGYRSNLRIFDNYLSTNDLTLTDVDNAVLENFLAYLRDERDVTHKTMEQYFTALSTLYDFLVYKRLTETNFILPFRKRFLGRYKHDYDASHKQLLSVEDMSRLVNSILDSRNKAIAVLLAKTGVRRGEMLNIDVDDLNWEEYSIRLKPTRKRSNCIVFFDHECAIVLRRWLKHREKLNPTTKALFISYSTFNRLSRNGAYEAVVKYARRLGLHNSASPKSEDHFGPHCFRHWFTTWLLETDMPREYVKELRGDKRKEAIDLYHHINKTKLRQTYSACIPKLGI